MKNIILFLSVLLTFCFAFTAVQKSAAQDKKMIKFIAGEQEFSAVLYDTPAANALYAQLPLTLTFEDFNGIEKIAYMDNKLPTEGEKMEFDPNGRLNSGIEFFAGQENDFVVRIEKVE